MIKSRQFDRGLFFLPYIFLSLNFFFLRKISQLLLKEEEVCKNFHPAELENIEGVCLEKMRKVKGQSLKRRKTHT